MPDTVLKSPSKAIYPNKVPHKPYPLIGKINLSILSSSSLSINIFPTFSLFLIIAISSDLGTGDDNEESFKEIN